MKNYHSTSSYIPELHNRQSMRLKGYDYSKSGLYFITINCYDKNLFFGEIKNGELNLNDAGEIANKCWLEIPNHFPKVVLHEYVIMPNHIHGIIEIDNNLIKDGLNLFCCRGEKSFAPTTKHDNTPAEHPKTKTPFQSPSKTIGSIVRGFKIGVTKWMRTNTNVHNVWQRNYHDKIIWNNEEYFRITEYIRLNPKRWNDDV